MNTRQKIGSFLNRNEYQIRTGYEILFLLYVAIVTFEQFYPTTMFSFPETVFTVTLFFRRICEWGVYLTLAAALVVTAGRFCPVGHFLRWKWQEIVTVVPVCLLFCYIGYWGPNRFTILITYAILICGAHGLDFRKVTGFFFCVTAAFLAACIICSLSGVIVNLDYRVVRLGMRVHCFAFGIIYPTDFCAHVFFCLCCYVYTRSRVLGAADIIILSVVTISAFVFTFSLTSFICNVLLVLFVTYIVAWKRRGRPIKLFKGVRGFCIISFPLLGVLMVGMAYLYDAGSGFWKIMDKLLHLRLSLGHTAFERYDVHFLSQYVYMNGFGGSTSFSGEKEYFFLDSSYLTIIFRMGLLVFIAVMVCFVLIQIRHDRTKNYVGLFIIALIAIQCVMEHHLLEFFYHPFLLALVAAVGVKGRIRRNSL